MICKERFEQERFAVFKAPDLAHQATHILSRGLEKLFGKYLLRQSASPRVGAAHGSFRSSDARFLLASVGLRPRVGP